jgi:hypothetical protein
MGALFSLSKTATSFCLDASEVALLIFGVVLVIGIVGEVAKSDRWKKRLRIFEFMVIIGVAGELIADGGIFLFSRHLQTISEAELSGLNKQAADAYKEAEIARKEADSFDFDIAKANKAAADALERAARAQENLGNANRDAALAEQHAAEANRTAEQERLARIKIEERLSGWRLDTQAQARILEKLKPYSGTPFDFAANPAEYKFMDTVDEILRSARWSRQTPKADNPLINLLLEGKASINFSSGITIEFAQERLKDFGPAAEVLVKALIAEGIPAKGHVVTQGSEPNAIHIVIGKRE